MVSEIGIDAENEANISIETRMYGSEWHKTQKLLGISMKLYDTPHTHTKRQHGIFIIFIYVSLLHLMNHLNEFACDSPAICVQLAAFRSLLRAVLLLSSDSHLRSRCSNYATWWVILDSYPGRRKRFFLLQNAHIGSVAQQISFSMKNGTFPRKKHPWRKADRLMYCRV